MTERLAISSVRIGHRWFVVVYDLQKNATIPELTEYALYASTDKQLSRLTLEKRVGQLINFWDFLLREKVPVEDLSDAVLARFRDDELRRILKRAASHGNELTARRTVNDKLGAVYAWLDWMVESGRMSYCGVTREKKHTNAHHGTRGVRYVANRSPVAFRRTGSTSTSRTGYVASSATVDAIAGRFLAGKDIYSAHRNELILAIADAVGFRRGSIASLCTHQFERGELEQEQHSVILVRPRSQKFAYEHDFLFPVWLALRVCDFCDTYRTPLVSKKRASKEATQDRIFLSSRNAHPLTERAITQIFSKAMRAVGAPKGAALHAFRAKYANDQVEQEIEIRSKTGMDTSSTTIAAAVAMKLGHKNSNSIYSYVVAAQTSAALREKTDAAVHVARLSARMHELQLENQQLRKLTE